MMAQLVLPISVGSFQSMEAFVQSADLPVTELVQKRVHSYALNPGFHALYLMGDEATGKTHLLHALHALCASLGLAHQWLSLEANHVLDDLQPIDGPQIICIDALDVLVETQELALLALFERARASKALLVLAGRVPAKSLDLDLADLTSRLSSAELVPLPRLNDSQKKRVLMGQAARRGLDLPERVIDWIMLHYSRDLHDLTALLHRLDSASLAAHKKITVPLLKTLLGA